MTDRQDYADAIAAFSVEDLAARLHGSLEHGLNACVECADRHVATGGIALQYESQDGRRASLTFAELQEQSARFANFLTARGIGAGDVVAGMLPRTPELLVTILGTWRAGAVYQPLFTAFGPKAIEHRLKIGSTKLVVTDAANRGSWTRSPTRPPSPWSPPRRCATGILISAPNSPLRSRCSSR